ncbi:MAG TPA: NUDIX domain-containing protein [Dongiaceae bacterium]|jgi:8-oxo-dGTP pyrophosphatase MutT (NUDIX family)|nr:NUDIX domain-containing protein [Dongiaceae bacterium]
MPAPRFSVSVKGVIFLGDRVVLLRNEREEWELPGGRLESGEEPVSCLVREVKEELGIAVAVEAILDCWRYEVAGGEVVIVTYGCRHVGDADLQISAEHKALGLFGVAELAALTMPEGYRRSIRQWHRLLREQGS